MSSRKFGFRIRTRSGVAVDKVLILGQDSADAERRLRQMYLGCQILETWQENANLGHGSNSFEEIVDLLNEPPQE